MKKLLIRLDKKCWWWWIPAEAALVAVIAYLYYRLAPERDFVVWGQLIHR